MDFRDLSRRSFMVQAAAGAGAAWLAASWPEILAAHDHALQALATPTPPKFEVFSPQQAADADAIASAIIPTTDTPGAHEAGVVYFMDRGLATFAKDQKTAFLQGLTVVADLTKDLYPAAASFSSLSSAEQIEVLKVLEAETPGQARQPGEAMRAKLANGKGAEIFGMFRFATVIGFLANPEYGGNRDHIGWNLLNFKPAMAHFPPFGYYDKEYREQQAANAGRKS